MIIIFGVLLSPETTILSSVEGRGTPARRPEADDVNGSPVSSEEAVNTMMKIMQARRHGEWRAGMGLGREHKGLF